MGNDKKNKFSIKSPYAQDKLSVEHFAKTFFEIYKIPSIGLRMFNVYGPGQPANSPYSSVIPKFIKKMKNSMPITINGGFQTRDFIYIQDVIFLMLKSMEKLQRKKSYGTFNVCTGRSVRVDFLFNLIKKKVELNSKVFKKKLDKFDPKKSSGNSNKILKFLNLKKYNFTSLEDGLDMTINHIRF